MFVFFLKKGGNYARKTVVPLKMDTTYPAHKHFVPGESGLWLNTLYSLPVIKVENGEWGVGATSSVFFLLIIFF